MKYIVYSIIAMLCCSAPLSAGPLLPLSIADLTQASDVVFHGKVISKKIARDESGRIFTTVRFKVHELWKGDIKEDIFEVVHGGGILGNRKIVAPYQVDYRLDEEAVVFCRLNSKGKGVTIGLVQGKFKVMKTLESSKKYVRNLFHGGPPPDPATGKLRYRLPNQLPLPFESLKAQVEGGER